VAAGQGAAGRVFSRRFVPLPTRLKLYALSQDVQTAQGTQNGTSALEAASGFDRSHWANRTGQIALGIRSCADLQVTLVWQLCFAGSALLLQTQREEVWTTKTQFVVDR
jgi:hypothetical protein